MLGAVCALSAVCALAQSGNPQIGLSINAPNGYANVQVDDMVLSSSAGPVRWVRQWDGKEWQFNPHWESLSQSWTNLTGSQTGSPTAPATLGAANDAGSGCWVMVDEDWQPQKGLVRIDERPPFPLMLSERATPFNKLMGEDGGDYPPPRMVSIDYASLCKGIALQNSPVRDLEAVRLKNELYMGENGRYAYSNRSFLEKRAVQGLAAGADVAAQLASGSISAVPVAVAKGYRWMDKGGDWIDYNTQGQVIAYGDRNNNTIWLVRDHAGLLRGVVDAHGRVLYTLHYTDKLLTEIRDYPIAGMAQDMPARSVKYQYDAGNRLIGVIDVRGNRTGYDYDAANHLTAITDQENRTTRLDYAGSAVKKMIAADAGVTEFQFEYDDVNKEFTSRMTGPETAAGRRVELQTHNRSGKLVRTLVNGQVVQERQYDTGARAQSITDARGFTSRVTRDEFEQIVKQERADGSVVSRRYAAPDLTLLEETDPLGTKTRYERDSKGNISRIIEAADTVQQRVTEYETDAGGRTVRQTQRGRNERDGSATPDAVTVLAYDERGNASSITDPEGGQTQTVFNRAGQMVTKIDARNNTMRAEVNPAGLVTALTDGLKKTWTFEYDKVGNRTAVTDPEQHTSRFVFDAANRRTETIDPKGRQLVQYDLQGMPVLLTDADARTVRLEYDNDQRPSKQIDGAGNTVTFGYQIADGTQSGRLGSLDEPTEIVYPTYAERKRYDQMGRLTSTVLSAAAETERGTQTQFDARGVQRAITDPNGKTSVIETDLFGRAILVSDRLHNQMALSYDVRGNLTEVKDANGRARRLAYDRNNRLVRETLPLGQSSSMGYDANGNLNLYIDANKNKTIHVHDGANRVIASSSFDSAGTLQRSVTWSYDAQGALSGWAINEGGKQTSALLKRDEAGRKITEAVTYPGGYVMQYGYAYSAGGKKTGLTLPDDSVIGYAYSKHGELASVSVPGEGSISVTDFTWLAPAQTTLPGGTVQAYQYDGFGNTKALSVTAPNQVQLLDMHNTFDLLQEKSTGTRSDANQAWRTERYTYDDEARLRKVSTEAHNGASVTETFGLDAAANRTAHSALQGAWTYDDNGRLRQRGTEPASRASYDYDDAGNLIRSNVGGTVTEFSYNTVGRLTLVRDGAGAALARYGYDAFGRRIWKEQYRNRAGAPLATAVRTLFLYSDEGLLAEATQEIALRADQSVEALSAPVLSTTYGPRPDRPFSTATLFIRTKNSQQGTTTAYYHHDDRMAPVQATDRDGHIVWAAQYDAFGRATLITPAPSAEVPTITSRLRLPGQVEDEETGLHYNFLRDYDPATGRYLQSDPIGMNGGLNPYAYVGGNPIGLIDPTGELATVSRTGNTITVTVPVWFDPKVTNEKQRERWEKEVANIWNKGNWKSGKCDINVVPDFHPDFKKGDNIGQ
ncbi:MAG TPA: RHS repeat-associated core domain-containing protein, partial [Telluria sp.]